MMFNNEDEIRDGRNLDLHARAGLVAWMRTIQKLFKRISQ